MNEASSSQEERFPSPQPISGTLKPALRGIWYGGQTYNIDKVSGKLATEFTPTNLVTQRVIPNPHEILYWVNKNDPTGAAPANPYNDPQFALWEVPAQRWISTNGLPSDAWSVVPSGFDDIHKPEFVPQITIVNPTGTTTYNRDEKMIVKTEIKSNFPIEHVDFFINGTFLGSTKSSPFEFSFVPADITNLGNMTDLRIAVYDTVGNSNEATVTLSLTPSTTFSVGSTTSQN